MAVSGIWVPDGMDRPQVWLKNIKVSGTETVIAPIDKWNHHKNAVVSENAVKLDWTTKSSFEIKVKKDVEVKVSMQVRKVSMENQK
ncbi:MAG: hypothetical protein JXR78_12905 [Victivallales bacterium]|nr:hypothetical protein [Victivallales bacterium]